MDNFFVGCIGGERRGGGSELGALGCWVHLLHVTFTPSSLCRLVGIFQKTRHLSIIMQTKTENPGRAVNFNLMTANLGVGCLNDTFISNISLTLSQLVH